MHDTAIYIGRFQPVHNGHRVLLQRALASARQVIVVLGSAWQARSPKNPFTWQEREAMLRAVLPEADQARVQLLPVRDYYNQAVWVQAVHRAGAPFTAGGARIGLVGHFKDATSSYLSAFPGWELMPVQRQGRIDASAIRDAYLGATPASARPPRPPPARAGVLPPTPAVPRAATGMAHAARLPPGLGRRALAAGVRDGRRRAALPRPGAADRPHPRARQRTVGVARWFSRTAGNAVAVVPARVARANPVPIARGPAARRVAIRGRVRPSRPQPARAQRHAHALLRPGRRALAGRHARRAG